MKEDFQNYDLSRSDKFYTLKIPKYFITDNIVYYQITLKDLVNNDTYQWKFRYKQLKSIYQSLQAKGSDLPPFPKTHFWQKTNSNPKLIEQRKVVLQNFFSHIVNDPFLRGYQQVKKIIRLCKQGNRRERRLSNEVKLTQQTCTSPSRSYSYGRASKTNQIIERNQWKKLKQKTRTLLK